MLPLVYYTYDKVSQFQEYQELVHQHIPLPTVYPTCQGAILYKPHTGRVAVSVNSRSSGFFNQSSMASEP